MRKTVIELAVVRAGGGWRLLGADQTLGDFQFRVDAEEFGLKLVAKARVWGDEIVLLVQDPGGQLRPFEAGIRPLR